VGADFESKLQERDQEIDRIKNWNGGTKKNVLESNIRTCSNGR
jgi:hypothetical protein